MSNDESGKGPPSQPGLGAVSAPSGTVRMGAVGGSAPEALMSTGDTPMRARTQRLSPYGMGGNLAGAVGSALLAAPRNTPVDQTDVSTSAGEADATGEPAEAGATTRMTAEEVRAVLGEVPPDGAHDDEISVEHVADPVQSVIAEQSFGEGAQLGEPMPPLPSPRAIDAGPVDSGMKGTVGTTVYGAAFNISPSLARRFTPNQWTTLMIASIVLFSIILGTIVCILR